MNFEEVYNKLFRPVLGYIRGRINTPTVVEDLAGVIWQKAWANWSSFDEKKGIPAQWIFTIARNEVNKYYSRWRIKNFFSLTEHEDTFYSPEKTPFELLSTQEQNQCLLAALKGLSARERDLLSLKFYSGLSNRQIAQLTRLSESNVGTVVHRAVEKLRARLEEL